MDSLPMLTRSWWILALRGALAVLFGILALAMPDVTLLSLIVLFAVYAVLAGSVAVAGAIRSRRTSRDWWILLLLGIVSLAAGLLAALRPGLTALALVILIAVNALLNGALDIALAVRLRKFIKGEWLLMLSAATSIAFGLLLLIYPGAGALALVWIIGVYALLIGALYLALAYRGRRTAGGAPQPIDGAAG